MTGFSDCSLHAKTDANPRNCTGRTRPGAQRNNYHVHQWGQRGATITGPDTLLAAYRTPKRDGIDEHDRRGVLEVRFLMVRVPAEEGDKMIVGQGVV